MKTQKEKVKEWLDNYDICGSKVFWDDEMYYSLRIDQIISIANYIKKKPKK